MDRSARRRTRERDRMEARDLAHLYHALRMRFPGLPPETAGRIADDTLELRGGRGAWGDPRLSERLRAYLVAHAWARHACTEYEALLDGALGQGGPSREAARIQVSHQVYASLDRWRGRHGRGD